MLNQLKIEIGATWDHIFQFSQEDVIAFAKVTGDTNPLHLDAEYAATTAFKKPIIHGMLGACVFSKVLGTIFPGPNSIYLAQTLEFLKPMYPDVPYRAEFQILDIQRKRIEVATRVKGLEDLEQLLIDGRAFLRIR